MLRPARPGARVAVLAGVVAIAHTAVALLTPFPDVARLHIDVTHLGESASRLLAGRWPYVDFDFVYPPLALLPALLPHAVLLTGEVEPEPYARTFGVAMALSTASLVFLSGTVARRFDADPVRVAGGVAAAAMLLAPILPWRYDALVTIVCLLAVSAHLRARWLQAGILTAAGAGLKAFPALVFPVAMIDRLAKRDRSAVWRMTLGTAVGAAAMLAPFALRAPLAPLGMAGDQLTRGLQLESTGAGLVLAAGAIGLVPAPVDFVPGWSWEVRGPAAAALLAIQPAILLLATLFVLALLASGWGRGGLADAGPQRFAAAVGGLIGVLLLANRVLSPQHVIWLAPFVGIAAGRRTLLAYLLAAALSSVVWPFGYRALVVGWAPAVLLLNVRNLLLLAVVIGLVRRAGEPSGPSADATLTGRG